MEGAPGAPAPMFGDAMIFVAQIFAALHYILEEKYLSKFRVEISAALQDILEGKYLSKFRVEILAALQYILEQKYLSEFWVEPLLAVRLEGMWGLALCAFAIPALSFVKDPQGRPLEDGLEAVRDIVASRQLQAADSEGRPLEDGLEVVRDILASRQLQAAVVTSILCIRVLNFFGLKVTRALSGASRATIDVTCAPWQVVTSILCIGVLNSFGLKVTRALSGASRATIDAVVTSILCIGVLNFFGLKVTRALSGASRATIDACRTLFVWMFSLYIGWEAFHWLQIGGFVVLVTGTSLYNEIIRPCLPHSPRDIPPDESISSVSADEESTSLYNEVIRPCLPHSPRDIPPDESISSVSAGEESEESDVEVDDDEVKRSRMLMGEEEDIEGGGDALTQPLLPPGQHAHAVDLPATSRAHK
eukprot:gene26424-17524_t